MFYVIRTKIVFIYNLWRYKQTVLSYIYMSKEQRMNTKCLCTSVSVIKDELESKELNGK